MPPEDKDPILLHAPTRKSVACFGAVNLRTGQFVRRICKVFNAATFQRFLAQLLRYRTRGRRIILVLDNARYHHAVILAPFLRRHAAHLKQLFLPPYSPQRADRAALETDSAASNAQPLLPHTRRRAQSRQRLLQSLALSERDLAEAMLHYLRRRV